MPAIITYRKQEIQALLKEISDPEIPVLNIVEMGIVREVTVSEGSATVKITPTYSGCPAMMAIEQNIQLRLAEKGVEEINVKKDFSEPWTTDWMSDEAKEKLNDYGIALPRKSKECHCPQCNSKDTEMRSIFGSTPCKALYYCNQCEEPFERFKCI